MSDKKRFIKSSLTYSVVQVLVLAASLISFPILTRVLSVSEYGILGLCNTLLLFGAAFAKLGLQNSIVRFYAHYRREMKLDAFFATIWCGGTAAALIISLLLVPVALFIAPDQYKQPFLAVILVVFGTTVFGIASNFLRAEERNNANSIATVLLRYGGTFGGIALVYWSITGISGIFYAQFAFLLVLSLWYFREYNKRFCVRPRCFSKEIFSEAITFGSPLIIYEFSSIMLAFSDRFLVSKYCGMEQLGIYTAGYTISFYIADIVRQPLQMAVGPIYLRIYAENGLEESVRFLQEVIGYVSLVIFPIFAGCTALKHELMVLLASSKYAEASDVIPWVLGSTLLFGCQSLLASSFSILKQTRSIALLSLVAAVVNIALNILLLKSYGIIAAAWATAIAYILMTVVMAVISYRSVKIEFPLRKIAIYVLCSTLMYMVVTNISLSSVFIKIAIGGLVYSVLVLLLDRKLVAELRSFAVSLRKVKGNA
ncbi:MAG: oligosaccharide flippase family protein [Deltaproteobacteria bacterium]|nr:oligosaccharide flippase family protein [Deltaproteobacteria bacterium]